MTYSNSTLTAERLREILDYSPDTGVFVWKIRVHSSVGAGSVAGTKHTNGYIYMGVCGKTYKGHRLAWFYIRGVWPKSCIDHINGNKADNRIENLREATPAENSQNRLFAPKTSSSGCLGVSPTRDKKWCSKIRVGGKAVHLGTFPTPELAHAAYVEAKRRLHPFGML